MIELSTGMFGKHWRIGCQNLLWIDPCEYWKLAQESVLDRTNLSRKLLNYAVYTAIDSQKKNKDLARSRLREWASNHNLRFEETSSDQWCMAGKRKYIEINFKGEDIFDFVTHEHGRYDLMIANAFLDLVDIPTTLPLLLNLLDKGGLIYFTINYDGVTIMEPVIDSEFDE